jgi:hypothetical protein
MSRRFNRRPPIDAERDDRRHAERERIEQGAPALLTTEGLQRWIHVARPTASPGTASLSRVADNASVEAAVVRIDDMSWTRINAGYRFECVSGSTRCRALSPSMLAARRDRVGRCAPATSSGTR